MYCLATGTSYKQICSVYHHKASNKCEVSGIRGSGLIPRVPHSL